MFNVYKITKAGDNPEKKDGKDLIGLLIAETDDGFFLVDTEAVGDAPIVLSNALFSIKQPPIAEFKFDHKKLHWKLIVVSVKDGLMTGWWHTKHQQPGLPTEEDNWTAKGTGTGVPGDSDEYDEARAASAK